jgi:hypothetical protein
MARKIKAVEAVAEQGLIWSYYKPRHLHSWNMLQIAAQQLVLTDDSLGFELEYGWENLIIRLCLYRNTVNTLTNLDSVRDGTLQILGRFDNEFTQNKINALLGLRNMLEHFDDYAAGRGRGPAQRNADLDPWRVITADRYCRGQFELALDSTMKAADNLCLEAKNVEKKFIDWYRLSAKSQAV